MKKKFALTVSAALLASCASSGVKVDQDKLSSFQKGKTTYTEVVQSLGNPTSSTITSDGTRIATYMYFAVQSHPENFIPIVGAFVGGADTEHSQVVMNFDKNGVLTNYSATEGGMGTGTNLESIAQNRKDVRTVH